MNRLRTPTVVVGIFGLLLLAGCTATPGPAAPSTLPSTAEPPPSSGSATGHTLGALFPTPPNGEVAGAVMVLDDGESAKFCLGVIMESLPPQCIGVPLDGWKWDDLDGIESSGDTRWGAYAVRGTYNGERMAVTASPLLLALYDPVAGPARECLSGGGSWTDAELAAIQEEVFTTLPIDRALGAEPSDGCVFVDVVWDDGAIQQAVDDAYGQGTVRIFSALREVD